MSALNEYDFNKLLDDIKLVSRAIKIARDENNPTNRDYACLLVNDLIVRFNRDMKEMKLTLSDVDYDKLLFDIDTIKDIVQIVRNENNPENREFACKLAEKLVDRLFEDIESMKEVNVNES
jgi:hypothetical protein